MGVCVCLCVGGCGWLCVKVGVRKGGKKESRSLCLENTNTGK